MSSVDAVRNASENTPMEARIARIEAHVENLQQGLGELRLGQTRLDAKVDRGFERLDAKMDRGFERFDARIERLDAKIDRHLLLLGGMIVSLGVGIAGLMAKGFHWV